MLTAASKIPVERLWFTPDCGLKTRTWAEVTPALTNMVKAARHLRKKIVTLSTVSPKKVEVI